MPRKRQIPILGPSYVDPNLHWSRQDTLNWLLVKAEQGGTLTQWQLRDAPGPKPFVRITREVEVPGDPPTFATLDVGAVRGMRNVEGKLFVVAAQTLYQISSTGVAIPFGTIPGVGRVSLAHNQVGLGNELIIVNGSAGYVFDTNTNVLTKITDEGYPGAFIADYIDQYLAQVEPQGRFWFHSDLANGTDYSTLDRYEAEADPDRIRSLLVSHREVLVFGADTIEPFVNTGGQTGTFERASNTVIEVGCAAKFTPRKLDNSVFWLDDKRLVRRLDGYTPVRISTDAIDSAFQECSEAEITNCYAFTWESRGHKVYYITVPGRFTFGYDVLTGSWHRRSTWNMKHWDVVDAVYWNGRWIAGSGRFGRLYELDWDYKLDSCDPLVRKRVTGKLWDDENELTLNNVELKFNTGGPESVCALFPDQPQGPSISGDAPDGAIQTPYTFTYTVTPGDAPIARTVLLGTDVTDFGLTWNQYTATLSGTFTQNGVITLRVRTYDTNGLWAEVEDTINVGLAMLAIRNRTVAGQTFGDYLRGGAGGDFATATWTQYTNAVEQDPTYLEGIGDRFIAYATTGTFRYTNDYGATWGTASGADAGGSGGARKSVVFGTTIIVPGGVNEMRRSMDGGLSYAVITGSPDANVIAGNATHLVSVYGADIDSDHSIDEGDTWTDTASPGLLGLSMQDGFLFNGEQYFPGSTTGPVPALRKTLNGGAFSAVTIPAMATATALNFAITTQINGEPAFAIGSDSGEFLYFDPVDSTVKLSAQKMDVPCRGMTFNGGVVAAIGSGGGRGQIWTSADGGVTWVKQRDETGQNGEWNAIASMRAT